MSAPSIGGPHSWLAVPRGTIAESGTQAPLPQLGFCHLEGSGRGGHDLDLAAYASTGGGDGTDLPFLAEPHGPQHADVLDIVETFACWSASSGNAPVSICCVLLRLNVVSLSTEKSQMTFR
ncbi:hypothetical protein OG568_12730 [Streptomyces sp. NBC_01450]|uniref:hypothetical protein n=1 Tax=Streptomyces sp. NBC_01450 TaxID=2903871 RepID=UPI002E32176E|nr:hypothetical protein [Streptomyces sp. NBC_01450]